jgi:hypothetical protein
MMRRARVQGTTPSPPLRGRSVCLGEAKLSLGKPGEGYTDERRHSNEGAGRAGAGSAFAGAARYSTARRYSALSPSPRFSSLACGSPRETALPLQGGGGARGGFPNRTARP